MLIQFATSSRMGGEYLKSTVGRALVSISVFLKNIYSNFDPEKPVVGGIL